MDKEVRDFFVSRESAAESCVQRRALSMGSP